MVTERSLEFSRKVAIQDANILIDLEYAGLIDLWLQLGVETHTTDFITEELENGGHQQVLSYIRNQQIIEKSFTFEELVEVDELHASFKPNGAGIPDASVLLLAIQMEAILLTGDRKLRKEGLKYVEVHGTLWILEELIKNSILTPLTAADKLEYLLSLKGEQQRHLPLRESEKRINHWRTNEYD